MATPFAGIETSINAATRGALANATLSWNSGINTADGLYSAPSNTLLGDLVQGADITFSALTSEIGTLVYGTAVAIAAVNYTVARNEPDGAGWTRLTLQKA